jgi:hypothetical protein
MRTHEKDISFEIIGPPLSLPGRHRQVFDAFQEEMLSFFGGQCPYPLEDWAFVEAGKQGFLALPAACFPFLLSALTGRFATFPNLRGVTSRASSTREAPAQAELRPTCTGANFRRESPTIRLENIVEIGLA